METILIFLVIGLFVAMLFLNIYFRVKVLQDYRTLSSNKIDFSAKHIFEKGKMKEEIVPKHPEFEVELLRFSSHLRYSIRMATVLIILITLFGGILMYFR